MSSLPAISPALCGGILGAVTLSLCKGQGLCLFYAGSFSHLCWLSQGCLAQMLFSEGRHGGASPGDVDNRCGVGTRPGTERGPETPKGLATRGGGLSHWEMSFLPEAPSHEVPSHAMGRKGLWAYCSLARYPSPSPPQLSGG